MDEHKILENFGINLKHYRNKAKMSQDDVVEVTGFSKPYISNVENAKHDISLVNAIKFANIFDKTVDEMIQDI
ncbi:MAG: helix-turn-helix domain-containing protein [Candidatus Gastranaerophilales bacterium]|nr:helix-turn-helix domain-containing protein [Candidatus Gastranaerophilales bacterium]